MPVRPLGDRTPILRAAGDADPPAARVRSHVPGESATFTAKVPSVPAVAGTVTRFPGAGARMGTARPKLSVTAKFGAGAATNLACTVTCVPAAAVPRTGTLPVREA